jgi:hypothetical protein
VQRAGGLPRTPPPAQRNQRPPEQGNPGDHEDAKVGDGRCGAEQRGAEQGSSQGEPEQKQQDCQFYPTGEWGFDGLRGRSSAKPCQAPDRDYGHADQGAEVLQQNADECGTMDGPGDDDLPVQQRPMSYNPRPAMGKRVPEDMGESANHHGKGQQAESPEIAEGKIVADQPLLNGGGHQPDDGIAGAAVEEP